MRLFITFHWLRHAIAVVGLGLLAANVTWASETDEALMQRVHGFLFEQAQPLGEEVIIELRPPSRHLPPCIDPKPFLTNADQAPVGRVSVGVRCGEDGRQVRYMQAEIGVIGTYVIAAHDIERGAVISASMLTERSGNLNELPAQALLEAEAIVGQMTRSPIRAESIFQAHFLQKPPLVERGQRVTVEARGSAFRVTREGEALETGGAGDRIRVRFGPRELISARVTENGTLVVDF